MKTESVTITANGVTRQIELPLTLGEFLRMSGWRPTQVVVELNSEVVPRSEIATTQLHTSDRLEIIVPVAGG